MLPLKLTDIFNELTANAIRVSKDLMEGIEAIRVVSYFCFIGAFVTYFIGGTYGWGFQAILIPLLLIGLGTFNMWRFRSLKSRYSEIYQLREQLEVMKG